MPTTPNSRYFNEDELSAIVNGQVSPQMPTDLGEPTDPAAEPSKPIWDTYDTVKAVPRGAIDAAKGVYNLADWATMDLLPDWHTNPLGTSTSWSGSIVSGISQVATGFLAAGGVLGAASKIPGAVGATAGWLGGAGGGAMAVARGGAVKGAIADFTAFEANSGRLSDLLVQADNPALNNAFTQFMATDMSDSELEGRLKNALEGGFIGVAFEGIIAGVKGSMKAVKEMKRLRAAGKSEEEAVQGAMKVAGKDLQESADAASRAEDEALMAPPEVAPEVAPVTPAVTPTAAVVPPTAAAVPPAAPLKPVAGAATAPQTPSVDQMRTVVTDPPSVKELHDMVSSGADTAAIATRVDELSKAGLINLNPILGKIPGQPGVKPKPPTANMYEEVIVALRQFDKNPGLFGKAGSASNEAHRMQAMGFLKAAAETGQINGEEMIQLMRRGVVTAQELYRQLPFILGLEAATRHNALQAIRAPGADADSFLKAFTVVSGATRTIKSYLGKNLQMVQAFGDMDTISKGFNALSPADQRVRMEMFGDALELLLRDPSTGRRAATLLTEGSYRSGMRVTVEMFRNSILSGPKTLAVNSWNGLQMLAMPFERAAGKALSGDLAGAGNELSVLTRYWSQTTDAYQALKISLSEEGDSFVLGRGNQQYGDEFVPGRRIGSKGVARLNKVDDVTGAVQRTPAGAAVDFVGQVVNAPMRALGSSDEFFMTLVARSEADTVIRAEVAKRMKKPLTDAAVSAEVSRLRDLLFIDGQLYTRKTVEERGFRQARDKYLPGAFRETLGNVVADRLKKPVSDAAVVAEVSRLYNASIKAGKVDREAIKAIADVTERNSVISALDASGAKAKAHPLFIPEVQRYVDQNWDAYIDSDMAPVGGNMQQAAGEDYRVLQRVSGEVERRVKEQTWKRDYTDIADESAPFGSRIVGNIGKAFSTAVGHVPELQLIVPFIKTPTNLLAFVTDRNPIGQGLAWVQAAKAGDKKAVAQAAGRLATGTVLYTTGIGLAANGLITGKGPVDPDIRKQLLASGWQPYAIKVGGVYVSFGRNDPVATFLGIVADTVDISRSTYDPTPEDNGILMGISKAAMMSIANNVTSKSYLRGLTTAMSAAMGDEAAANKMMRQFAGAVVPNALAQTEATFTDSTIYETRNAVDAILARLPFTGNSVDKTRNALGEPLQGAESPWSLLLPVNATKATKDPVNKALSESLISVGGARRTLPGNIDLKKIKLKNGQSAYDRYGELTGQVKIGGKTVRDQLRSVISSPFFKGLPEMGTDGITSPRTSLIRGQVSDYRRAALEKLIKESPELAQAMAHARDVKANLYRGN